MHPRTKIIEIFATFLQFDGDRFRGWATDGKLRRSMQQCLQQTPKEVSETFWALYWYRIWESQSTNLPKEHLVAYFQEPCYWTSRKTALGFANNQYKLSDCFQIAIAQVDKVLSGFNPDKGFVLKNYASAIFASVIRDTLRQRHEIDICSDWGLLRKISQKRLAESLQTVGGLSPDTVTAYITAWNCFKSLYVPQQAHNTRQLVRPDDNTWQAIAQAYQNQTHSSIDPKNLETWLLKSAKVARKYLYPDVASINVSGSDNDSQEWIDNIPAAGESLLGEMISTEEQQARTAQQSEINAILATAVGELEPQAQEILDLYYTQGLKQQDIAEKLQIKQYTISRRLTKARETLLKTLAKWSQQKLHISVNSDILKGMSAVMEEWLQNYYSPSPFPKEKQQQEE